MLGESTDLLDGTRSALLEANTVALYSRKEVVISLPPECHRVETKLCDVLVSAI
jgi:hypothetical protein